MPSPLYAHCLTNKVTRASSLPHEHPYPTLAGRPGGGRNVRPSMSFQARRELLIQVAARYREADRTQKTVILDEFVASTGYARKYAIRLLTQPPQLPPALIRRPRA